MHARARMVHLDLRNAHNILVGGHGTPSLLDFQSCLGTRWMPPPLRRFVETHRPRGDLQALGQAQPGHDGTGAHRGARTHEPIAPDLGAARVYWLAPPPRKPGLRARTRLDEPHWSYRARRHPPPVQQPALRKVLVRSRVLLAIAAVAASSGTWTRVAAPRVPGLDAGRGDPAVVLRLTGQGPHARVQRALTRWCATRCISAATSSCWAA